MTDSPGVIDMDRAWVDQPQGEAAERARTGEDRVVVAAIGLARELDLKARRMGASQDDQRIAAAAREWAEAVAWDRV